MKLSMSMYSLVAEVRAGRMDLMSFIDFAVAQRVAGVELLEMFWSDAERELPQVKQRLVDVGLETAVYSITNNFIQPDANAREQQLTNMKRGVDTAVKLGVDLLRVFSGDPRAGVAHEQGMEWILEGLAAGAAYALEQGVTLALENHGRFAGRSDQVQGIIDHVGSPALRVNFDTGNFLLAGQDPAAAARELADLVVLVHLKDIKLANADEQGHVFADPSGRTLTGSVIGQGLVDMPAVIAVLREAGYDGWLSLEYEGSTDPFAVGVPQSLEYARNSLL